MGRGRGSGPGRPRKHPLPSSQAPSNPPPRGRGRGRGGGGRGGVTPGHPQQVVPYGHHHYGLGQHPAVGHPHPAPQANGGYMHLPHGQTVGLPRNMTREQQIALMKQHQEQQIRERAAGYTAHTAPSTSRGAPSWPAGGPAPGVPMVGYGFTPPQMKALYAQIMAFKTIVKKKKVPKKVADMIMPPPLVFSSAQRHPAAVSNLPNLKQPAEQKQKKPRGRPRKHPLPAAKSGANPQVQRINSQITEDDFESHLNAMRALASSTVSNKKAKTEKHAASATGALPNPKPGTVNVAVRGLQPGNLSNLRKVEDDIKAMKSRIKAETLQSLAQSDPAANGNGAGGHAKHALPLPHVGVPMTTAAQLKQRWSPGQGEGALPKFNYIAGLAGCSKQHSSPAIMYQYQMQTLQGLHTPVASLRSETKSLVGYAKGPGNILSTENARKITQSVALLCNQVAEKRVDRAVEEALADLGRVVAAKRQKKTKPRDMLKYTIQSRALKLRGLQKRVRSMVLGAQLELQVMKTKEFYKTARQIASKKVEMSKQDEIVRKELISQRAKDLRRGRQQWVDLAGANQDKVRSNTKRLMQFHAKLSGDFNKVEKEDRRKKMMRALEEKDAEAYASLVREGLGGATSVDKDELKQLEKFLDDTENYLKDLEEKLKVAKLKAAVDDGDLGMAELITRENGEGEGQGTAGTKLYDAAHSMDHDIQLPHLLSPPGLRSYQVTGLKWMTSLYKNHLNGILADEMGLGKTVQVISLLAWLMEYKNNMGPHLIIVPNAVVPNWRNELKRWFPSATACVYIGNKEQRNAVFASHVSHDATYRSNIVITTYEFTLRDRSKLAKVAWKYVIMDEAHRIKDRTSKLADAVDRLNSERRLLLTGTPLQNDLQEVWSLLNYLLPNVFDDQSKKAFREWFDEHLSNQVDVTEEKLAKRAVVIQRLHQALEPFMLRRQVEDVEQSLPPKIPHTILCALSSLESVAYRWLSQTSTIRDIRGGSFAINNKAMELKKLCNHLIMSYPEAVLDHTMKELIRSSGKMFMLDRILMKMFKSGHRVLLFSTMTKALDILQRYVIWRGWAFLRIDGTTPIEEREMAIQEFNNTDDANGRKVPFIFLLSIRAAGRGLNLQSADTVILYDPDPNPKNEEQAIARSHRIGQEREVRVFHLECVVDAEVPSVQSEEDENLLDYGDEDAVAQKQGRGGYQDSIESVIRKEIQKYKIDMANEVIDAGRFDLQSSKEEKRKTLQTFLQEHITSSTDNYVIGMKEVNRLLARNAEEIRLFDQLDKDEELWVGPLYTSITDVPSFLQFSEAELQSALPKSALPKNALL